MLGDLRRRLANGEFRLRFPGDDELTAEYGVSRHTVREAAAACRPRVWWIAAGVAGSSSGTPVIEQPLGALYSVFRSVEEQGFVQRSIVWRLEERRDEEAAAVLGRSAGEPLIYRGLLGLPARTPALAIERLATWQTTPVEWAARPGTRRPVLLLRPLVRQGPGRRFRARQRKQLTGCGLAPGQLRPSTVASIRAGGPPASMARSMAAGTFRSVARRRPISPSAAAPPRRRAARPARSAAPNRPRRAASRRSRRLARCARRR
ncbi:MAG: hypothetical protein ACRDOL_18830 [Streptosporangiaceae bacterium]